MPKDHDIVVFGATGYTGRLVVEYLAKRAPAGLSFCAAGRDEKKLRDLAIQTGREVDFIVASADDRVSLRKMAERARVVLSCAGPFARLGEPLVAACVDTRTDYIDITGEPDFVRDIIERHDARASQAGVRVVPCCGFDCIPADLGTLFTMRALAPSGPASAESFVHINWDVSGGTWQSMLASLSRGRGARSFELPHHPEAGRRVRLGRGIPRFEPEASGWIVPSPMIDPQIVLRSAASLDVYGPDFSYGVYFRVGSLPRMAAMGVAAGAIFGLSQVGPARELLSRLKPSGDGASEDERNKGFFRVTTVARSEGERVVTRVSGGDKYVETATMSVEAALLLAQDRASLPDRAGVLTPATAFGDVLVDRLDSRGVRFEVMRRTKEGL